jgi:hypothetical protein
MELDKTALFRFLSVTMEPVFLAFISFANSLNENCAKMIVNVWTNCAVTFSIAFINTYRLVY